MRGDLNVANDLTYFKRNAVNYYGVFDSQFDEGNPYTDILTDVRRKYYESGLRTQKHRFMKKTEDGSNYKYNYTLNEDFVLKWKVFNEAHIVERVIVSKEDSYRVEIRDRTGKVLKKCIYFGIYHNWVKTKYFVEGKDKPEVELVYWDEKGVAVILKYTADGDDRYPEVLYPCSVVEDKELFAKITERLGVPEVFSLCSNGLVYFAEKSISRQWNRFCADPGLLDKTTKNKNTVRNDMDKTAEFDPIKDKPKLKPTEPRKRIDLTQTYDVIVPNVVQADSVVINKKNENSPKKEEPVSTVTSRNVGLDTDEIDLSRNDGSRNSEQIKVKLHSDSLRDIPNKASEEKSKSKKNVDVFEYLNEPDNEPNAEEEENIEPDAGERRTLAIDDDDDDDDNRILDRSGAAGNEPPHIFEDTRQYNSVKARDNVSSNPFAEYSVDENDEDTLESIARSTNEKTLEDLQQVFENKHNSEDSRVDISKKENNKQPSSHSNVSNLSDSFKNIGYTGGMSISPDKIIKISDDEVYYYYGGLNNSRKRNGHGRTAMKNGMTAYDGGYQNDLRNGFGVYYYRNGKICYVGDWKDNHRHGVGISFTHKGRSMYVGGWENDCPIGMGAKFDENGNLTFAGRYENGSREGIGMVYNPNDGGVFVSCWDNDKLSDRGTVFDSMGNLVYNGSWKHGTRNGMGTQYDKKGLVVYSGEWKDGKYHGEGSLNLSNGYKIVGQFVMGKVEGYAVVTTKKGKKLYEGNWKNNRYNGEGKLYNMRNGSWCQGTFANGNPVGVLSGYNQDGEKVYEGEWLNGKYHGSGVFFENDEKVYEGEWDNGIKSGSGREYKDGKCVYTGNFKNNMRSGFGTSYDSDGQINYSGLWSDNCYDGIGVLYVSGKPKFVGNFLMGMLNGRVNEINDGIVVKECIYKDGECNYMREYTDDGLTLKYEGHVKDGNYEGMGCRFSAYGEKYFEGIFKNNEPFKNMKVRLKKLDKLVYSDELSRCEYNKFIKGPNYVVEQDYRGGAYSGLLVKGKPSGKGTIIYTDHGYTGSFTDGAACGLGVIYEWDGSEIKGTFSKNANENTTEIKLANGITYYLINP